MILYFSATGNTKWIAQQLSTFLSDSRIYSITNVESDIFETLEEDEPLGICFPIHAWSIPDPMVRVLEQLKRSHRTPYIYMVCTCGDDCGKAHLQFARVLKKTGHKPQFMASVQMPNTYVNLPGFDVDSAEKEMEKKAKAEIRIKELATSIMQRKNVCDITEGAFPILKSTLLKVSFKRFLLKDKYFKVTDDCIGCGLCVQNCPSANMLMEMNRPIWLHNGACTSCMSCYHHCPKRAIRFGKYTDNKGQYYFK